jgi:hypothetical protein
MSSTATAHLLHCAAAAIHLHVRHLHSVPCALCPLQTMLTEDEPFGVEECVWDTSTEEAAALPATLCPGLRLESACLASLALQLSALHSLRSLSVVA